MVRRRRSRIVARLVWVAVGPEGAYFRLMGEATPENEAVSDPNDKPPFWPPPTGWEPGVDVRGQPAPKAGKTRTIIEAAAIGIAVFVGLATFLGVTVATAVSSDASLLSALVLVIIGAFVLPAVVAVVVVVHYLRSRLV